MSHQHYGTSSSLAAAPAVGSIQKGKIVRVEPSFLILQLLQNEFHRLRGLLHVSEMASLNGAKMQDVWSLDDVLYAQVLSVTTEQEGFEGRPPRIKIKLSTKHVDPMTGNILASNEQQHSLEQNLNSSIGMGVALDPMANIRTSNLILKSSQQASNAALINGYALVDDFEGEPEPLNMKQGTASNVAESSSAVRARPPLGRGRGMTLPAWMTRGDANVGMTKQQDNTDYSHDDRRRRDGKERKRHSKKRRKERDGHDRKHHRRRREHTTSSPRDDNAGSDLSTSSFEKRRSKKRRRRECGEDNSQDMSDKERRHRRRDHRHSRRHHYDSNDESDGDGHRHSSRRKHHKKSRRRRRRSNSDSDEHERRPRAESRDGEHDNKSKPINDAEFSSVAEAERLIAELEEKKRRRGDERQ